jgi:membrane-bound inhibitor of C-type lysozyme
MARLHSWNPRAWLALLLVGEGATRLPQLPAASGARYGAADQEFWIKGDRASWRLGAAPPLACGPRP